MTAVSNPNKNPASAAVIDHSHTMFLRPIVCALLAASAAADHTRRGTAAISLVPYFLGQAL
jgi:hypothetical protein